MSVKKKDNDWVLVTMLALILLMVLYSLSRVLALQRRVMELELSQLDEKTAKELIHEEMGTAVTGIRREISSRLLARADKVPVRSAVEVEIGTMPVPDNVPDNLPELVEIASSPQWNVGMQNFTRTIEVHSEQVSESLDAPQEVAQVVEGVQTTEEAQADVKDEAAEVPTADVQVKPSKKKGGKKAKNGGTEVQLG